MRRYAWMIGSSVAAASGILIAPLIGLDPLLLTLLVVQAFGAAALGRFRNLAVTFAGGLAVGVGRRGHQNTSATSAVLGGLPPSLPFIVLFVVLLSPKKGTSSTWPAVRRRAPTPSPRSRRALAPAPSLPGRRRSSPHPRPRRRQAPVWISGAAYVVIFLSLGLLVKTSGQVSLCHAAFVAVGATTFSHLRVDAGLPWLVALLGAGLVAIPVGAFVALPAIRLSGVYLALATFGFGILMRASPSTPPSCSAAAVPRAPGLTSPGFPHHDTAFYYVALVVAVCAGAVLVALDRTRLGRLLRALGDSPTALATAPRPTCCGSSSSASRRSWPGSAAPSSGPSARCPRDPASVPSSRSSGLPSWSSPAGR